MIDLNEAVKIEISPDYMYASVTISTIHKNDITLEGVIQCLAEKDVKMGIDAKRIARMISSGEFYKTIIVATGKPAENGRDGYFQFFFDTEYECGYVTTEDGSVDFTDSSLFCHVKKGDVLARYIPPTIGGFGFDVRGKLLRPTKGRNLPTLGGCGFKLSQDGRVYFANIEGKVRYKNNQLEISEINQHWGNLDYITSNLKCSGDVRIHGNVSGGMLVEASGCVEIDGYVGAATIISGGDVLIKGGMKGNRKGRIQAGGGVYGKYFEAVEVQSGADIHTNYFLDSKVYSEGTVHINGSHGTIIGGVCQGVNGIKAENAGNEAGKTTSLRIGVDDDVSRRYMETKHNIQTIDKELDSINAGLDRLEESKVGGTLPPESQEAFNKLFQRKIVKVAERKKLANDCETLQELVEKAAQAEIIIYNTVYEGVVILTGKNSQPIGSTRSSIKIRDRRGDVVIEKFYRT